MNLEDEADGNETKGRRASLDRDDLGHLRLQEHAFQGQIADGSREVDPLQVDQEQTPSQGHDAGELANGAWYQGDPPIRRAFSAVSSPGRPPRGRRTTKDESDRALFGVGPKS